jgi:predicted MPP superfamily phosphohydrolase
MKAQPVPSRFKRRRWLAALLAGLPAAGLASAADGLLLEPTWLKVRALKLAARPRHRLVHFTDLHYKGDRAYLQKVVDAVNATSPEFVCFTGDIIEDAVHLPVALELLQKIKSPLYGIPGNHDYWSHADFDVIHRAFARTGGAWLVNQEVAAAGGSVRIFGVAQLSHAAIQPHAGTQNLLLIHYPLWVESFAGRRFDAVLAGHTHGGQVRLPFFGPLILPFDTGRYDLGLFQTPSGPLYVSSGIGTFYASARFNCRPEIVVVEI